MSAVTASGPTPPTELPGYPKFTATAPVTAGYARLPASTQRVTPPPAQGHSRSYTALPPRGNTLM